MQVLLLIALLALLSSTISAVAPRYLTFQTRLSASPPSSSASRSLSRPSLFAPPRISRHARFSLNCSKKGCTKADCKCPSTSSLPSSLEPAQSLLALRSKPPTNPIALRAVTSTVQVGVATASSYASSFCLGYGISALMSLPAGIRPFTTQSHQTALIAAKSWAGLGAAFTFFGQAVNVARPRADKDWNNVCASCATGAFLARGKGPSGMATGCMTYSGFTYMIQKFTGGKKETDYQYLADA
jgi:hypothetical protein